MTSNVAYAPGYGPNTLDEPFDLWFGPNLAGARSPMGPHDSTMTIVQDANPSREVSYRAFEEVGEPRNPLSPSFWRGAFR